MSCFFIGGVNRSGTTLLQSILCSDKTTNPLIHEASYLRNIVEAYVFGQQQFDEHNKYYFSSAEDLRDFTARWAREFIEKVRQRYPTAEHIVLKHPPLTPRFPALFELLSSAGEDVRFFIIIRDPRDVAASLVRVGERLRSQGQSEGATLPRDMSKLGNYYMRCYTPALSHQDKEYQGHITLIKYEDLVTNPAPVIENIRRASGLRLEDFDETAKWKGDEIDYTGLRKSNNAWLSELWGKQLSNKRIGSYKEILTPGEIAVLEDVCAGPLKTFNYNR
ncbi:MAG TPA: sulfotransferase [Gammaproteobacteria bacterium]|nr:sulfotransferase [Gammaproteobacteria bacterium]